MNAFITFITGLLFFAIAAQSTDTGPTGAVGFIVTLALFFLGLLCVLPATYIQWHYDLEYWKNWFRKK